MARLALSTGGFAEVDAEDLPRLKKRSWWRDKGYVVTGGYDPVRKKKVAPVRLHRFVLGVGPETRLFVDHKDRNPLNNKKANLRLCNNRLNQGNLPPRRRHSSRFRGVHWVRRRRQWQAQIRDHGKLTWLGYFKDPREAAKVYDKHARRVFGEFANLNFGRRGK